MRILGIDPGLQTTGFGCDTPLARLHAGCAGMSLHRNPSPTDESFRLHSCASSG